MAYKFPLSIDKIAAGAVLAGCVVITLRAIRLLGGGVYLVSRRLRRKEKT